MAKEYATALDAPTAALFAKHYLASGLDAREAVLRTGLEERPTIATRLGRQLLLTVEVQAALAHELERLLASAEVQAERVLGEYQALAYSDVLDYVSVDEDGRVSVRDPRHWPSGASRAVRKIKVRDRWGKEGDLLSTTLELELYDKPTALRALGEHLQLFVTVSASLNLHADLDAGQEGLRGKLGEMLGRTRGRSALGPVLDAVSSSREAPGDASSASDVGSTPDGR